MKLEKEQALALMERIEELGLCDHCLGRTIGMAGHGLTNAQRGEALRTMRSVLTGEPKAAQPEECDLCGGLFDDIERYVDEAERLMNEWEHETFLIGSRFPKATVEKETGLWESLDLGTGEPIKTAFNRMLGRELWKRTGKEVSFDNQDVLVVVDLEYDTFEIDVRSLYFQGRYRKLERGIPQTRWPCKRCRGKGCERCGGTGKMYPSSVEEIVAAPLMECLDGKEHAFHGMGREDVDALMLGNGRPFVVEIRSPRRRKCDVSKVVGAISQDGQVEVDGLVACGKDAVQEFKSARPEKSYRVRIASATAPDPRNLGSAVEDLTGATVEQRTPERVSHRRADLVRRRTVAEVRLTAEPEASDEGPTEWEIEVRGDAGLYIKELVHGDGGRTEPSLSGLLGIPLEVLELDVLDIHI